MEATYFGSHRAQGLGIIVYNSRIQSLNENISINPVAESMAASYLMYFCLLVIDLRD